MNYHALATDYDGTIATDGVVFPETLAALKKFRESGHRLILVTGRELPDLFSTFKHSEIFDRIIAENGAVLYDPSTKESRLLSSAPPESFLEELKRRDIAPISEGQVIVATWEPHQNEVLQVIREMGLGLQVIFNKGAVMVLPSGINKATGLNAALTELKLSPHNVVGVGDAENDHSFLEICGCSVAVANALPAVKDHCDLVMKTDHGAGVVELIEGLLQGSLNFSPFKSIPLGENENNLPVALDLLNEAVLICGTSGSGKSTLATSLLERVSAEGLQIVIFDPEGDYNSLEFLISLGSPERIPLVEEVIDILRNPERNLSLNLLGVALEHRPELFAEMLKRVLELRSRTGHPHLIVVDETHHLLPTDWKKEPHLFQRNGKGILYITVHPESVARSVLETVNSVLVVGENPEGKIQDFCSVIDRPVPPLPVLESKLPSGTALLYRREPEVLSLVRTEKPTVLRKRHSRKYPEGNLGPERSFYFRGPDDKLNLKAHNLILFVQLADGVDDETWLFHLHKQDYSAWLRRYIKNSDLALEVSQIELDKSLSPIESRLAIRRAIEANYTLPADQPSGRIDPQK
ncbi:HAD-IIB family hydrolase [Telmatocola sphagniphila]|uniref:HAD-IIB family hydrolase n=1 Tax=Telmatocola sphagniphila TaxID=1123043 RepID=A0A8E6B8Z6_9BACT|nr:HAD-IIB family hydrolase [Telmatocola sphagniphila]QVL33489.1 HAD-IIB family hydrolase [Telmatocola sphagniphila]